MQTIGKMDDGRVLAALSQQEYGVLMAVETMIEVRMISCATISAPAASVALLPAKTRRKKSRARQHPWRNAIAAEVRAKKQKAARQPAAAPKLKSERRKFCEICAAKFTDDSRTNTRKTCNKASCHAALAERYKFNRKASAYHRAQRGAKKVEAASSRLLGTRQDAASTTNPSDPLLTDEQRKDLMARREKLIAASAQRHAED